MKFISIGRIAGTYGLEGELKIKPNTSHPELFGQMEFLLLTQDNELKRSLKIEDIREHNNLLIVRLKGIASESDAAKLKGLHVSITEDMLPKADDDEVYWFEIEFRAPKACPLCCRFMVKSVRSFLTCSSWSLLSASENSRSGFASMSAIFE